MININIIVIKLDPDAKGAAGKMNRVSKAPFQLSQHIYSQNYDFRNSSAFQQASDDGPLERFPLFLPMATTLLQMPSMLLDQ